ncbi:MAG: 5-(carboxyamino)imidazole ribonucleotide synthase, partial [Pseudomonadota bacterium]
MADRLADQRAGVSRPHALAPNSTIGILGGGQLGRMAALAAANLGYRCHIFTPELDSPAAQVAAGSTVAPFDDHAALSAFAQAVDVVTLEFENVPLESVEFLSRTVPIRPGGDTLRLAQHRALEKTAAAQHGLTPVRWRAVTSLEELYDGLEEIGTPAVLKTARLGYDGKGQQMLHSTEAAAEAWDTLATDEAVLEQKIDLVGEISVITVRGLDGKVLAYPPGENIHRDHILATTRVPAQISPALIEKAAEDAKALADALGYIGVLGVEFFIAEDDTLYFNEMAPRPHNSGHWTMDAAVTSQFEQQIRAITGLPLG